MTVYHGVAATRPLYDLAEGILWDDRDKLVRWVDIWQGRVLAGKLHGSRLVTTEDISLGQTAGAVALAEDGGLLIAASCGLATISPTGAISFGPDLLGDRPTARLNDGTPDMFGAFVVGSLTIGGSIDGGASGGTGDETLLRIQPNGAVEVIREGIQLSNGVAFSPDGGTIYHVDTFARTVSSHPYGFGAFNFEEPWVPLPLDLPDYPDGLAVDSEGALWVAQWGGSSVRRHAPTGELLDVVTVDAEQVSCPGFVGPDLDRLAITSAQEGLESFTDLAGSIFIADVSVTGLPTHRWAGSTTTPYWLAPKSGG
ncbi:MAG: SMP-30/gluconolactonase/LRE family protein [Salinibacterium sp.]|nr:SMP-30/gluconolactonase/LRE family protein [Salinibacterium sp.]